MAWIEQCVRNILVRRHYAPDTVQASGEPAWISAARDGSLSSQELLTAYTTWVYARSGSYEATAQQLGVDRRTVKTRVDGGLLKSFRASHADE